MLNKKKGQDQIFFLAGLGQPVDMLKGSLFIEKLDARVGEFSYLTCCECSRFGRVMKSFWLTSPWMSSCSAK